MPISIDNTNYHNNEYGRYSSADAVPVRDQGASSYSRDGLSSGTTVTGEIVEKDGNQVTIRLSNEQTISAKLSGNADIEVGMKMTFEVASNNRQISLRPLFSNLANNNAAMSALKAAGLPVNNTTLAMTDRMMTENMPVNRNALAEMFRNVSLHGNASPESIVQMTKLNMPLTETNVIQFDNYRNFEHQITSDLNKVSEGITDLFREAVISLADGRDGNMLPGSPAPATIPADATLPQSPAGSDIQNVPETFGNMSASEVISEVLDLIDTDNLSAIMPSEGDIEKAVQSLMPEEKDISAPVPEGEAASVNDNNAEKAASVIRNTVEGFISDVKDLFTSRSDGGDDIAVNSGLSLTGAEQLALSEEVQDILVLAGKGSQIRQPLDPSEVMKAVKELVNEYPPEVEKITEAENLAYSQEQEEVAQDGKLINEARADIAALKEDGDPVREEGTNTSDAQSGEKTALKEAELVRTDNPVSVRQTISEKLAGLLRSDGFSKLLKDSVKAQMSVKPEEVAQNGKIEDLYSRILKTSSRISQLMENIGRAESAAAQSSAAINDNVAFMNHLNEFVNYVQIPLKMAGEDANGELYVYTNKKNLSDRDGNYSALLHLDMEHLGPMDVYVTMRDHTKVSTNFYLQSEELLDFMEAHIDMLTKRLEEKGYDTNMRVSKKEKGLPAGPVADEFTKDEPRIQAPVMVSRMRFDVRA